MTGTELEIIVERLERVALPGGHRPMTECASTSLSHGINHLCT